MVTAKLISAFVFATRIVQSLYSLNPKFQASSHLLWLYGLLCVGPGRIPHPVFSQRDRFSHNETGFLTTRPISFAAAQRTVLFHQNVIWRRLLENVVTNRSATLTNSSAISQALELQAGKAEVSFSHNILFSRKIEKIESPLCKLIVVKTIVTSLVHMRSR